MEAAIRRSSADWLGSHATYSESKIMSRCIFVFSILTAVFLIPVTAQGEDNHEPLLRELVAAKLRTIAMDPAVVSAIMAQNAENNGITAADIERLDKQWRAETDSAEKPLISRTVGSPLSGHLKQVRE